MRRKLFCIFMLGCSVYADTVYVTNTSAGTFSIIDSVTNTVVTSVGVGVTPVGIAVANDNSIVCVSNASDNTVSLFDTGSSMIIATVGVGTSPQFGIVVTPDRANVFVANTGSASVSQIDTSSLAVVTIPVGSSPFGLTIAQNQVFVGNNAGNSVSYFDVGSMAVSSIMPIINPVGLASSPDGTKVYVASNTTDFYVIDRFSHVVSNTLTLPGPSGAIAVSVNSHGTELYVGLTNSIQVINADTETLTTVIPLNLTANVRGIAATPDGQFIYAVDITNSEITVIETASYGIVATISDPSISNPFGIAIPIGSALSPPTNLKGVQKRNNFGVFYEIFNTLTWRPSSSTAVTHYNVYANEVLIAVVSASAAVNGVLTYEAHNVSKGRSTNYFIAAATESDESDFIAITVP